MQAVLFLSTTEIGKTSSMVEGGHSPPSGVTLFAFCTTPWLPHATPESGAQLKTKKTSRSQIHVCYPFKDGLHSGFCIFARHICQSMHTRMRASVSHLGGGGPVGKTVFHPVKNVGQTNLKFTVVSRLVTYTVRVAPILPPFYGTTFYTPQGRCGYDALDQQHARRAPPTGLQF